MRRDFFRQRASCGGGLQEACHRRGRAVRASAPVFAAPRRKISTPAR